MDKNKVSDESSAFGGEQAGLDNAQNNQDKVGSAANNPDTTGPAENLRAKAAEAEDESEGSRDSV